ncbi:MAG: nicotinate (nicotinamide) nucleotide adenylyltransferase [Phycisphaerales bacterium]|nr:nicotinate (nicotinamide) nucleotide adenylyltransferase [Phycisphaerales bacterium]
MDNGVVLFGGSFNPVHHGHLLVARSVAEHLGAQRIVLIPAAQPPHKYGLGTPNLAPAEDRLEMLRRATAGDSDFEVSDIELRRAGPSYTILTVETYLRMLSTDVPCCWLIGADTLEDLHTWHRVRDLCDLVRIVTAARPGFETPNLAALAEILPRELLGQIRNDILPTPRIDISASQVRQRISAGRSIRYLVPEAVRTFIEEQRLYRGTS